MVLEELEKTKKGHTEALRKIEALQAKIKNLKAQNNRLKKHKNDYSQTPLHPTTLAFLTPDVEAEIEIEADTIDNRLNEILDIPMRPVDCTEEEECHRHSMYVVLNYFTDCFAVKQAVKSHRKKGEIKTSKLKTMITKFSDFFARNTSVAEAIKKEIIQDIKNCASADALLGAIVKAKTLNISHIRIINEILHGLLPGQYAICKRKADSIKLAR